MRILINKQVILILTIILISSAQYYSNSKTSSDIQPIESQSVLNQQFMGIKHSSLYQNYMKSLNLTVSNPISIYSDEDFNKYNFTGNGTVSNPFIIRNIFINTTESFAIFIYNISKHLIIKGCVLTGMAGAIHIADTGNATITIEDNICSDLPERGERDNGWGIYVYNSTSCVIRNNTFLNITDGIEMLYSPNAIIENNNCTIAGAVDWSIPFMPSIYGNGISIAYSPNTTIRNNYVSYSAIFGVEVTNSNNCTISNNFFKRNGYGGSIIPSLNEEIGSVMVRSSHNSLIYNNTIIENEGKAIYLSKSKNILVSSNFVRNSTFGIFITYSSNFTLYYNQLFLLSRYGIYIYASSIGLITYNLVYESTCYAVVLDNYAKNNTIYYNTFAFTNCQHYDQHFLRWPASEAYDNGSGNIWYSPSLKKGNWWSYWDHISSYRIDGNANSYDIYPLEDPTIPISSGTKRPPQEQGDFFRSLEYALNVLKYTIIGFATILVLSAFIILIYDIKRKRRNSLLSKDTKNKIKQS